MGINTPTNTLVKVLTAAAVSVIAVSARTKNHTATFCAKSRNKYPLKRWDNITYSVLQTTKGMATALP